MLKVGLAAAVNGDTLAVSDAGTCSIVLFSIRARGFIKRIGSCGEGPDEFRTITALAFSGPRLVIYDHARAGGAIVDANDQFSQYAIREPDMGARAVMGLSVDGEEFTANASFRTLSKASSARYVLVGNLRTGIVSSRFVSPPPIARASKTALINTIGWCTARTPGGTVFVAVNQWHPEIGIWARDLESPSASISAPEPFGRPRFYTRYDERLPRFKRVRVGCGRDAAVVSFEEIIGKDDDARIVFTYVAVEYTGAAYVLPPFVGAEPSGHGHIVGATNDTFFVANAFSANGHVDAFRLTTK
jgi:hypothetical protein